MNFSFVLPTLGNEGLVTNFLESLERTTCQKKKIEVLFAIDEGKTEIISIVQKRNYSFDIKFFERPLTRDFTNDYYNFLANRSRGANIIAFNDDAWIRTHHWDVKILQTIKEYGWSIYMLDIPDTARIKYQHTFPCFPCVSRRGMNTLGWLLCRDVPMYPADKATFSVYYHAKRIIPIRNVLIEHDHILENDPSKARMMEIFNEDKEKQRPIPIGDYVLKLGVAAGSEQKNDMSRKFRKIMNIIKEA